jgi:hypothetical protein
LHCRGHSPPIDLATSGASALPEQNDHYIVLSRPVSSKHIDLAIQARTLMGRWSLIIGDGPDRSRLMGYAGPTVS